MPTLFRKTSGWRWHPDSDAVNAPDGALLRAENTIPDATGARVLRSGSRNVFTGLNDLAVRNVRTALLQGQKKRFANAGSQIYREEAGNFSSFGEAFDGYGDVQMGDDSYQAFFARGSTKKKFDGTNFFNWGIDAPAFKPTLSAVNAITYEVASCDAAESPAFTIHEGGGSVPRTAGTATSDFVADYAATAEGALKLTPDANGICSVSKKFTTDIDMLNFNGTVGTSTDLFDLRAHLANPRKVYKITLMFGLGTGTDPFVDDYYLFDFNLKDDPDSALKDPEVNSVEAYTAATDRLLNSSSLSPAEITDIRSPEKAGLVVKRLTALRGQSSSARRDTSGASPAWGHFTVSRGQFKRVGTTSGRNWETVRGFKVVYSVIEGSTPDLYISDGVWTGGGSRSLTGTFRIGYRYARTLYDNNGAEIYTELSGMSPVSDEINLAQQTLSVTIPSSAITGKDAQVTQIWVYLYGGWLDTYYRVAITSAAPAEGMTIDDISSRRADAVNFDEPEERARLLSFGFSLAPGSGTGSNDLTLSIFKSELDALIDNEPFEPGAVGPPDGIIGIAGPWRKRMFALTDEGWLYISSGKRPSSFSVYHAIDLRRYGTPYWIILSGESIYVGCSSDIIRIAGSGDLDSTGVLLDLYPQEMSVANPPVDSSAATDGNAIFFRSGDGPMILRGASLQPVPFAGTSFLWKGRDRHTIQPLETVAGRFRFEADNHNLYMLAPEGVEESKDVWYFAQDGATVTAYFESAHEYITGDEISFTNSSNVNHNGAYYVTAASTTTLTYTIGIEEAAPEAALDVLPGVVNGQAIKITQPDKVWKYLPDSQQWCRFDYGHGALSIWREYGGALLVGTDDGRVREIESGTDDDGSGIAVDLLTPVDDGGNPLGRKDPADLQVHANTGGATGSVGFFVDGSEASAALSVDFSCTGDTVHRQQLDTLGTFLKLQANVTGTFTEFALQALGVTYRPRPQQVMRLDVGFIIPPQGGDLAWINQVELDAYSPVDLQMLVYKNGILFDTVDIPVTANIRDVYTIVCKRGTKGRRLQLVFVTTNSAGEGNIGFEPYGVKVRHTGSGNVTELPIGTGDQGSV